MKIDPRTLKGFRDFLPNEARKRAYVIEKLKSVFESYGFEPLETPSLEYAEILTGKYGDEGDKLMYKFKDNGDRDVALRYDQTVPLARVVAQYGDKLPMPFKRYQIQNVWRAENTQKGRFREFLQCDIDTVGAENINADIEVINCISECLDRLGFKDFKILINDRRLLFQKIKLAGIEEDKFEDVVRIIDKIGKITWPEMDNQLLQLGIPRENVSKLNLLLSATQSIEQEPYLGEMYQKLANSKSSKVAPRIYLARGLDYYTGLIFEVEIEAYSGGSVAGGGRYDELIGMFSNKKVPAVGAAFGFDRLIEAMDELNLFPKDLFTAKVLVLNLPEIENSAFELADKLRAEGINTEVYLDSNIEKGKQFSYAEKKNIPYTIIPNDNTFTLGWKENGQVVKEENISLERLLELLSE